MNVYFVRHGESLGNKDGYTMGQDDVELTDRGRKQAKEVGQKLKDYRIDLIVTSPLIRASETAKIIAKTINYKGEIETEEWLTERYMGEFQGHPTEELLAEIEKMNNQELQIVKGLESLESLKNRTLEFLKWLRRRKEQNILLVGHHTYSKMLRVVIDDPSNYLNVFAVQLLRIKTGNFIQLDIN